MKKQCQQNFIQRSTVFHHYFHRVITWSGSNRWKKPWRPSFETAETQKNIKPLTRATAIVGSIKKHSLLDYSNQGDWIFHLLYRERHLDSLNATLPRPDSFLRLSSIDKNILWINQALTRDITEFLNNERILRKSKEDWNLSKHEGCRTFRKIEPRAVNYPMKRWINNRK